MFDLPHIRPIYEGLCAGRHFGPDDGDLFDALHNQYDDYRQLFAALGLNLIRHEPEFFYVDAESADTSPKTNAKMALFCYILVDHFASQGTSIEEAVMSHSHLVRNMPHFAFDRYAKMMHEADIEDPEAMVSVMNFMEKIGWLKWDDAEQFRFLRPFYRLFSRCIELAEAAALENSEKLPKEGGEPE